MQGGLPPELDGDYYRRILEAIKRRVPAMHIHAFSPMEVVYGVERSGLPLRDYLKMLREAGLGSLPGTAAEILDDRVRSLISRIKLTRAQWVEVITTAHELGIPTTSTMMYGHIEQPPIGSTIFCCCAPFRTAPADSPSSCRWVSSTRRRRLYRTGKARPGSTVEEDVAVHALARILLNNSIPNLQISWVKLGWEVSRLCLQAGANDCGGTLMEENISGASGEIAASSATGRTVAVIHPFGGPLAGGAQYRLPGSPAF